MFIPCFNRFSDVVAWGHHLRLPLRSRNRESRAPRGKKHATINENSRRTISVIVTKRVLGKEEHRHPRQQDSRPLPKTPPGTPCIFFVLSGLERRTSSIARGPKNIDDFALTVRNRLVDRSSPFWLLHHPANRRRCSIMLASTRWLVYCCLFAFYFIHCHIEF